MTRSGGPTGDLLERSSASTVDQAHPLTVNDRDVRVGRFVTGNLCRASSYRRYPTPNSWPQNMEV